MERQKYKHSKIVITIIVSHCIFLVIYFSMALYFRNRFYFGSTINSIDVSGKTVKEADEQISDEFESYELQLEERGGVKEIIRAVDIGLKYNSDGQVEDLKNGQSPLKWISSLINRKDNRMTEMISYDENLLKNFFDKLSCFDNNNIIEPQNASFKYGGNGYEIIDEVYGSKVDKETLYNEVVKSILKGDTILNLESRDCYIKPQYTSSSKEVIDTKDMLNKYISAKITYNFGDKQETLDGSIINNWIGVNDNFEVVFDENKMRDYLNTLFSNYETVGKTRTFATSFGSTINVGGGDYGWLINTSKEIEEISVVIKEGKSVTKEPTYKQVAANRSSNDIGNTYVEINLSSQHLWFYKNGSLVVEGNIVSGNVSQNHSTPGGVYSLKYKERNATLKGEDYSVPVSYWMPFNGGIGIHDANWRGEFGGSIYRTNGSHGCVNSPYYLASAIYNNIDAGTPIVCYY